ncbi:hypothetical protein ACQP26_03725 [Micromonospora sp. CA-248089]|uniref:hypothetical protein n=1 Tax=unclassified Micromonospora TaxID=2617518 RepID=UPI00248B194A|nr:hypothetical protein [Micromonospora sp. WMMA1947]WBC10417.1 hypothetical protein O7604_05930 [Micromonospora sp. WMMA1947]
MPNVALISGPVVDLASAASALADALALQVVSAGNVFRQHVQQQTPLGVVRATLDGPHALSPGRARPLLR